MNAFALGDKKFSLSPIVWECINLYYDTLCKHLFCFSRYRFHPCKEKLKFKLRRTTAVYIKVDSFPSYLIKHNLILNIISVVISKTIYCLTFLERTPPIDYIYYLCFIWPGYVFYQSMVHCSFDICKPFKNYEKYPVLNCQCIINHVYK